jgi:hypothetical protein
MAALPRLLVLVVLSVSGCPVQSASACFPVSSCESSLLVLFALSLVAQCPACLSLLPCLWLLCPVSSLLLIVTLSLQLSSVQPTSPYLPYRWLPCPACLYLLSCLSLAALSSLLVLVSLSLAALSSVLLVIIDYCDYYCLWLRSVQPACPCCPCKGHGVFRDTLLFLIGLNLIRKTDRYVGADLSISNRRPSLLPSS